MHYTRFLKVPQTKLQRQKKGPSLVTITTVISIGTDLGETFYLKDIVLRITVRSTSPKRTLLVAKELQWSKGLRDLPVQLVFAQTTETEAVVCVSAAENRADDVRAYDPTTSESGILSAWSSPLSLEQGGKADGFVERKLQISGQRVLSVWEETGESIARHIWAGGLALTSYIAQNHDRNGGKLESLHKVLDGTVSVNILELGAGCGIVGMALAALYQRHQVTITDLPLAEEIVLKNLGKGESNIRWSPLDWEHPSPPWTEWEEVHIVTVADCVYNPDSIPLLVNVLKQIADHWPNFVFVMAHKERHPAERLFYTMMETNGFDIEEKMLFSMGNEVVNLCAMKWHDNST